MSLAICCRLLGTKVNNVYKFGGYLSRNVATIDDYKLEWVRPDKYPCIHPKQSGDLGLNISVKPTDVALYYNKSKELEDADEIVKKMFTLEFQRQKESRSLKREKVIDLVKRHICDRGSMEVKIAAITSEIQDLQKYMDAQPRNKKVKVFLKELIDKRKKFLKHLRTYDYGRFEWVLERLNLEYKLTPVKAGTVSRKDSMRKITEDYCNDIIKKKFDKFKADLKEEQKKFYIEKAEKLAFILKEEIECGLTPTVTEKDIEDARKKVEMLNKTEEKDS